LHWRKGQTKRAEKDGFFTVKQKTEAAAVNNALALETALFIPCWAQKFFSVFIFNSLIQISSSSKGGAFLWTASFFPYPSSTWRLFNLVLSSHAGGASNMNNFQF